MLAEFTLLLGLGLLVYGLQEVVGEGLGAVLALPWGLALAVFAFVRGPSLAAAQAPIVAAFVGARVARACTPIYGAFYRAVGAFGLLALPLSLLVAIASRLA